MSFQFKQSKGKQFLHQLCSNKSNNNPIVVGGAFAEIIKSEEDKQKDRNVSILKTKTPTIQPLSKSQKKISEEKLKRFINFKI